MFSLQKKLLGLGGTVIWTDGPNGPASTRTVECDISGGCQSPCTMEMVSREGQRVTHLKRDGIIRYKTAVHGFMRVILHTKCRKCDHCRRKRSQMWFHKAKAEFAGASRNWFGTLTFTLDEHFMCETRCRATLAVQGVDFDALPDPEKFSERVKDLGRLVTLWIKRVRKNSNAPFRYLMIAEAHKTGLPHFHVLLHEQDFAQPIRKVVLQEAWPHGFSNMKLAKDERAALYVCKYLSKAMMARVRASLHYGNHINYVDDQTLVHNKARF